jgi:hypothetical protein
MPGGYAKGQRRSRAVNIGLAQFGVCQRKRRDQGHFSALSLDGMQGVTDAGDYALERHGACDAGGCAKVDAVPGVFR